VYLLGGQPAAGYCPRIGELVGCQRHDCRVERQHSRIDLIHGIGCSVVMDRILAIFNGQIDGGHSFLESQVVRIRTALEIDLAGSQCGQRSDDALHGSLQSNPGKCGHRAGWAGCPEAFNL